MSIKDKLHSLDFFSNLDDEQLDKLSSISALYSYKKDSIICYEKDTNKNILFLINGLAKAYRIDKHNNEVFLYFIHKNNLIS